MNMKVWHMEYMGGEQGEAEVCTPIPNVVGITYEDGDLVLTYVHGEKVLVKSFGMANVMCIRTS